MWFVGGGADFGLIFACDEALYKHPKLKLYRAKLLQPVLPNPCLISAVSRASVSMSAEWGSLMCPPHWMDLRRSGCPEVALPMLFSFLFSLAMREECTKPSLKPPPSLSPSRLCLHFLWFPKPIWEPQAQGSSLFPKAPTWALKATPPLGRLAETLKNQQESAVELQGPLPRLGHGLCAKCQTRPLANTGSFETHNTATRQKLLSPISRC